MLGITTMKLFQEWVVSPQTDPASPAEQNKQLLIVGMSATALESEQEEAFTYGMHFFCPKPVSLELLGIILGAKREFEMNEDSINKICEITDTNIMQDEWCGSTEKAVDGEGGGITSGARSKANAATAAAAAGASAAASAAAATTTDGGTESSQSPAKGKWTFFRSFKQTKNRVFPEEMSES
jgi:CheY-like chemotaxis protein